MLHVDFRTDNKSITQRTDRQYCISDGRLGMAQMGNQMGNEIGLESHNFVKTNKQNIQI